MGLGVVLPPQLVAMGAQNNCRGSSNNSGCNSSSESEDWEEESWTVDCPCGVTYDDGEKMVECDACNVWVHTKCCQVQTESLPTYVCDKCKEKERKRKEREESEVAQLLVELPGKTITFEEHKSLQAAELSSERRVNHHHEHGVPGGDRSFFSGVSKVFSQQLWKCSGYVPKVLQLHYAEIPNWLQDEKRAETLFNSSQQRALNKNFRKLKQEEMTEGDIEIQHARILLDVSRKEKAGRRLEGMKHTRPKHRGPKDEKHSSQGKRMREDAAPRKKMKSSPDAVKSDSDRRRGTSQHSPKNPKAMKKSAVQEFMDVDTRSCSKCHKPLETSVDDDQGKQVLCTECRKAGKTLKRPPELEGPARGDYPFKKLRHESEKLVSPDSASMEKLENADLKQEMKNDGTSGDTPKLIKSMKPPPEREASSTEDKQMRACQLSVKTSTFLKPDIPSPASLSSGGPSPCSKLPKSSGSGKLLLRPSLLKSSSKQVSAKKPDSCTPKSGKEAPTLAKDSKPKLKHSSSMASSLSQKAGYMKKHAAALGHQKPCAPQRDAEKRLREPKSDSTAKDAELALLLHHQLNSSPRMPRVPRQSSQLASSSFAGKRASQRAWRSENGSKYGETPLLAAVNRKAGSSDEETRSSRTESPEASEEDNEVGSAERGTQDQTSKHLLA